MTPGMIFVQSLPCIRLLTSQNYRLRVLNRAKLTNDVEWVDKGDETEVGQGEIDNEDIARGS